MIRLLEADGQLRDLGDRVVLALGNRLYRVAVTDRGKLIMVRARPDEKKLTVLGRSCDDARDR